MACAARIPQNEVEANGRILVAVRQSERPRAEDAVEDERRWLHELQCLRRLLEAPVVVERGDDCSDVCDGEEQLDVLDAACQRMAR